MKLYLIPTPIGNLEDMSFRSIRILKEVDLVLAEDTRQTKKLFNHYQIETALQSFHAHNEHHRVQGYIEKMLAGMSIAQVSDAGTPGISDPGFLLVRAAIQNEITVECLPGPTAFVPALVASGIPCDRFVFEGFLPQKKGRQTKLKLLAQEERTVILYESPHRINKLVSEIAEYFDPDRQVVIAREITKMHEEFLRGTATELKETLEQKKLKGEIVVIIAGNK